MVVIPESYEIAEAAEKHGLHATDIRDQVKCKVAFTVDQHHVKVHFKSEVDLNIVVFFIGPHWKLLNLEQVLEL